MRLRLSGGSSGTLLVPVEAGVLGIAVELQFRDLGGEGGFEIDDDVADGPQSLILRQVANGVAARMAVLETLLG